MLKGDDADDEEADDREVEDKESERPHVEFSLNSPTKYYGDLLRDIR